MAHFTWIWKTENLLGEGTLITDVMLEVSTEVKAVALSQALPNTRSNCIIVWNLCNICLFCLFTVVFMKEFRNY